MSKARVKRIEHKVSNGQDKAPFIIWMETDGSYTIPEDLLTGIGENLEEYPKVNKMNLIGGADRYAHKDNELLGEIVEAESAIVKGETRRIIVIKWVGTD